MLKFIGRLNSAGRQNFKAGVIIVKEMAPAIKITNEKVINAEGNPMLDEQGKPTMKKIEEKIMEEKGYSFKVADIGQSFSFHDESYVLSSYKESFVKE